MSLSSHTFTSKSSSAPILLLDTRCVKLLANGSRASICLPVIGASRSALMLDQSAFISYNSSHLLNMASSLELAVRWAKSQEKTIKVSVFSCTINTSPGNFIYGCMFPTVLLQLQQEMRSSVVVSSFSTSACQQCNDNYDRANYD